MKAPEGQEKVDSEERKDRWATQGYQEPQYPRETKVNRKMKTERVLLGWRNFAGIVIPRRGNRGAGGEKGGSRARKCRVRGRRG